MSEELENSVREMLKAESWTRAGISSFTTSNLSELEKVFSRARAENCEIAIKEICDEQLQHTKESIVALYLSGMVSVQDRALENNEISSLVDIFLKNHKEPLAEALCNSILLLDSENLFAIRRLADLSKASGKNDYWKYVAKIVDLDLEEADKARELAEYYETLCPDKNASIRYYKKALHRYIDTSSKSAAKNMGAIKSIWTKLLQEESVATDIDFFYRIQRKIAKTMGEDRTSGLMYDLLQYNKSQAKWDVSIDIVKTLLSIDKKDKTYRDELVDCYRNKYSDRSHLEDCIRRSNLDQSIRDVFESISDFEKHIAFDVKNFVFHRLWGVGIIRKVVGEELTIQFGKKYGVKTMKLSMAVDALQPLERDHIWVLKATKHKDELAKQVQSDIAGTLRIIIKSFNNKCDIKRIKAELVPAVLTPGQWTSWHAKALSILTSDKTFGVTAADVSMYMVRDRELSDSERLNNEFNAEKDFFPKIDVLMRFADNEETDKSDENFATMFNYFASFLRVEGRIGVQNMASYLVVQNIAKRFPAYRIPEGVTFESLYRKYDSQRDLYASLKDSKYSNLKDSFVANVKLLSDWAEQYVYLFPVILKHKVVDELLRNEKTEMVQKLVRDSFFDYRNNRDAVVFFVKECRDFDWFKDAGISLEKQLITLVNIISYCQREIDNHVNTTENKKTVKNACAILFEEKTDSGKKNNMLDYMLSTGDEAAILRLFTMVNDVRGLDYGYKQALRKGILDRYPDFKFPVTEVKQDVQDGIYVTHNMKVIKENEAEELEKVIIPAISAEIAEAREKGDLKENAEYIAAKDNMRIQQEKLKKLKSDISKAIVYDPTTVSSAIVSFGTVVTVERMNKNDVVTYTILGPFESDTSKGIISYRSPLGSSFLEKKVGETVTCNNITYTIKKIEISTLLG